MMNNSVVCLSGESSDLQLDLAELLNEGYSILDIHSQYVETGKGYNKAKSIIWLQKELEVTHG